MPKIVPSKGAQKPAQAAARAAPAKSQEQQSINEQNIGEIEQDTIQKVNKALSALESAIASWDASPDKSEDLQPRFMKYKRFHDALVDWETKMLRTPGSQLDFYSRMERLKEFSNICYTYQ